MMRMPTMAAPAGPDEYRLRDRSIAHSLQAEFLGRAASFAFYSLHVSR
jgi:hypothetical protein